MKTEHEVTHNPEKRRFEITVEGHVAVLNYLRKDQTIAFTHTGVPRAIEGRGLGSDLVKAGLDYARENRLRVKSFCWFVDKYIQRNAEYQDLIK